MQSFFIFGGGGTIAKLKKNFLCFGLGGFIDLGGFFSKGVSFTNFPRLTPPGSSNHLFIL
jgi:hypothetical protein